MRPSWWKKKKTGGTPKKKFTLPVKTSDYFYINDIPMRYNLSMSIRKNLHTGQIEGRLRGPGQRKNGFKPLGTFDVSAYETEHKNWAGNYWKQSDLLDSWSHGGARIELVKARHEAADTIRYCTKYLTKMKEFGIRTKQKFGDFYNYSGQGTEPVTSSRQ